MSDYGELLAKVKAAVGPDRELDAAVYRAFAEKDADAHWFTFRNGVYYTNDTCPPVTASIDGALALVERVLPGTHVSLFQYERWQCDFLMSEDGEWWHDANAPRGDAATAPLAILAALLTATGTPVPGVGERG